MQHDASDLRHDVDTCRRPRRYQNRSDVYKHRVNRGLCCQDTVRFALKLIDVFKVEDHKMVHKVVAQPYEVRRLLLQKGVAGNHPGYWISLANHFHASWVINNPGRRKDSWTCRRCKASTYNQWDCCFVCASLHGSQPDAPPADKGEAN